MKDRILNIFFSFLYASMMLVYYKIEILEWWTYAGFNGEVNLFGSIICLLFSIIFASILPTNPNTKGFLLTSIHYFFIIPSLIIIFTNDSTFTYALNFFITITLLFFFSSLKLPGIRIAEIPSKQLMIVIVSLIIFAVLIQIAFGGLTYFNLNPEAVYQFRRIAAADLPMIFGYIYSNVSTVLIPISLVLAVILRSNALAVFVIFASVMLFGMTHHKSVLFTPFAVLILYHLFKRAKSPAQIGWLFVLIPAISLFEIYIIRIMLELDSPGLISSYSARRALLVQPLLDRIYIEYFLENPKYFWATSKFTLGLLESPHSLNPAHLIGQDIFGDPNTSANTGIVGSGFANAGFFGSALYAIIFGTIISFFGGHGRRLGHPFVASITLIFVITIITSTDLTNALLTHGLLLLLAFLCIMPKSIKQRIS